MTDSFIKEAVQQVFLAGIEGVLPARLISNHLAVGNQYLNIIDLYIKLADIENIYVVGAGKASGCMAAEVEHILKERIGEGHIVVKHDHTCRLKYIGITEAGHPLPDLNGVTATQKILEILSKAGSRDLVICLLSGGGSSLLIDYPQNSSLEEIIQVSDLLIKSGASIMEINTIRKHLSLVKGGQLAKAAFPATLATLILSDVVGDPVDVIASGPTAADPTTYQDALEVISRYNLENSFPSSILKYLEEGKHGKRQETLKPRDPVLKRTFNYIIGNNRLALEAASKKASEYNLHPVMITDSLQGDSGDVADYVVDTAMQYRQNHPGEKPACLLFGGETTVKVKGTGLGGRNQHLALLCARKLENHQGFTLLAAGTDGTDGPTDAAGAIVDSDTKRKAALMGIDADEYLDNFDSYNFFKNTEGHVMTGPTMTNVMDMVIVIVE